MDPTAWLAQLNADISARNDKIEMTRAALKQLEAEQKRHVSFVRDLTELMRKHGLDAVPDMKAVAEDAAADADVVAMDNKPSAVSKTDVAAAAATDGTVAVLKEVLAELRDINKCNAINTMLLICSRGDDAANCLNKKDVVDELRMGIIEQGLFNAALAMSNLEAVDILMDKYLWMPHMIPAGMLVSNLSSADNVSEGAEDIVRTMLNWEEYAEHPLLKRVCTPEMRAAVESEVAAGGENLSVLKLVRTHYGRECVIKCAKRDLDKPQHMKP